MPGFALSSFFDIGRVDLFGFQKIDDLATVDDSQFGERVSYVDSKIHPYKISDKNRSRNLPPLSAPVRNPAKRPLPRGLWLPVRKGSQSLRICFLYF